MEENKNEVVEETVVAEETSVVENVEVPVEEVAAPVVEVEAVAEVAAPVVEVVEPVAEEVVETVAAETPVVEEKKEEVATTEAVKEEVKVEEKPKKKGKGILVVLLVLVLLCGLCAGGYYFLMNKDNTEESKLVDKETTDKKDDVSKSIKEDDSKEFVYESEYRYDNKYTETGTRKLSDLKIPHININSADAKKVNEELEKLYAQYAEYFEHSAACELGLEKGQSELCSIQYLSYQSFVSNDIASVKVWSGVSHTSVPLYSYYVYSFDLKTGKKLSYDELLTKLGYTDKDALDSKVKVAIDNYFEQTKRNDNCLNRKYLEQYKANNCCELAYAMFKDLVPSNRTYNEDADRNVLLYYADNDNNLVLFPVLMDGSQSEDNNYVDLVIKR